MNAGLSSALIIRQAVSTDAESLARFASQAFKDAYIGKMSEIDIDSYTAKSFDTRRIQEELHHPVKYFHLAFLGSSLIGYTKLRSDRSRTELKGKKSIELERIYVSGQLYRQGIGGILFNNALAFSCALGFELLWLAVWQQNKRALDFYTKAGMEIFGTQSFTVGTIVNKDYVLKVNL